MRYKRFLSLALIVSLCMFVFWGCPKKSEEVAVATPQQEKASSSTATKAAPEKAAPAEKAGMAGTGLQPIYFDFDKSFVRNDAKSVLKANADWLKANPQAKVKIEGNCDERGTKEYNQALGQRRAASAKKYITDLGVAASRISLISYGKEKSICTDGTESCWQQNRRDDLVVVK